MSRLKPEIKQQKGFAEKRNLFVCLCGAKEKNLAKNADGV